jgi:hypothetical protein
MQLVEAVTHVVGARVHREGAPGANASEALQRPPVNDAMAWRPAPDKWHHVFIGLGDPSKTQSAGFKRDMNLPRVSVMAFSTDHNRLLVPVASDGHGAC